MRKYAIHPGYVYSPFDGEKHFIGYNQLVILYKLKFPECICWDRENPELFRGRNFNDFIHLYPRQNGIYK